MVIITDNGICAARDFPGARILTRVDQILALETGTRVAVVSYVVGSRKDDPICAAETLIARGDLIESGGELPLA